MHSQNNISLDSIKHVSIFTYKFKKEENKLYINIYNVDSTLMAKMTNKYGMFGNVINHTYFGLKGGFVKSTYRYGNNGNKLEHDLSDSTGLFNKMTFEYYNNGDSVVERTYNSKDSLLSKSASIYNKEGNHIKSYFYNSEDSLTDKWTYKFIYDKHHNWIKKIIIMNGKPENIVVRKIRYY